MENTSEKKDKNSVKKPLKHICIGLVAHVDAGKTTLSEGMLYLSGQIRNMGRVDHGDTFLDNYETERERGITIFSKQAEFIWNDTPESVLHTLFSFLKETESSFPYPTGMHFLPFRHPAGNPHPYDL